MQSKKLGPLLLSGLMIGPILGSGIIILPPLAYETAGNWAFPAWCLIIVFGFFFARIFGQLTLLFPGEAGVSMAVDHAFGKKARKITGYYLMGAVLFGPVAVMLTAAKYLPFEINTSLAAMVIVTIGSLLLLKETAFIGKISLVLSTIAALTLLSGGITTCILDLTPEAFTLHDFGDSRFGYTMLLLFWTLVGWEVVGSYSGDVIHPEKTIPKAVNYSVIVIALVTLCVAAAIQGVANHPLNSLEGVTSIIEPIFGGFSGYFMSFLTLSLCVTTYLLFVGGVARLMAAFSDNSDLPALFSRRSASGAPVYAILFLTFFYYLVLLAVYNNILDVAGIVALADGFFLANALIGLFAAIKLIKAPLTRGMTVILSCIFIMILFHSSLIILGIIGLMAVWVYGKKNRKHKSTRSRG